MLHLHWTLLLVTALGLAFESPAMADPSVELTSPTADASVSISRPYVITWSARNLPDSAALSIRIMYTDQQVRGTINNRPFAGAETSRLLTTVFSRARIKKLYDMMHRPMPDEAALETVEAGKFTWNLPDYCPRNASNGKSICVPGQTFRIQLILRDAEDPCGDTETCQKPRTLFDTFLSRGTMTFAP